MFCGACARDAWLARGLLARGQEVLVVPLYLPLKLDEGEVLPQTPVQCGGLGLWLEERSRIFRYLPAVVRKLLAAPALLRTLSRLAPATKPSSLGSLTVSILAGTKGPQAGAIGQLFAELGRLPRPDLIWITNSLLSSLAPEARARLDCRVVCGWQGEDSFIAGLPEKYRAEVWEWLRRHAAAVDCFAASSRSQVANMAVRLGVPEERVRVLQTGVDLKRFHPAGPKSEGLQTLGYFSAITWRKGLDLLVDAFLEIARERPVRLQVAGQVLEKDYFRSQCRRIKSAGLLDNFSYRGELDGAGKVEFLRSCDVLALPSRIDEARGLAALEAQACGAAVVAPRSGVFPEMLELTGGGCLFQPGDSRQLAAVLKRLRDDPGELQRYREAATRGIEEHYGAEALADRALELVLSLKA
jgi:glycosyltransferase involved in cell wall biosynthesis